MQSVPTMREISSVFLCCAGGGQFTLNCTMSSHIAAKVKSTFGNTVTPEKMRCWQYIPPFSWFFLRFIATKSKRESQSFFSLFLPLNVHVNPCPCPYPGSHVSCSIYRNLPASQHSDNIRSGLILCFVSAATRSWVIPAPRVHYIKKAWTCSRTFRSKCLPCLPRHCICAETCLNRILWYLAIWPLTSPIGS